MLSVAGMMPTGAPSSPLPHGRQAGETPTPQTHGRTGCFQAGRGLATHSPWAKPGLVPVSIRPEAGPGHVKVA